MAKILDNDTEQFFRHHVNEIDGNCNMIRQATMDLDEELQEAMEDQPHWVELQEAIDELQEKITNWQEAQGYI